MSEVIDLAVELIRRRSVTPDDAGCQALIAQRLIAAGFRVEHHRYGEVDNLYARLGTERPLMMFLGHTDVVPAGPLEDWATDPFEPVIKGGQLYGRGAADMKGSVAAMVIALERLAKQPRKGSVGLLLTSDEEGPAEDGTRQVIQTLSARDETIQYCLVGEPSSKERLGDVIRVGRRGSLNATLTIYGVQGHVAYPKLASNALHNALPALQALSEETWDEGDDQFPPTGFQISNIEAGTGADNIIPGRAILTFNFRHGPASSAETLQKRVQSILDAQHLKYDLRWRPSGAPFVTVKRDLIDAVQSSLVQNRLGPAAEDTGGGTSDGRFVAPTGAQVVELGPVNATIHKANECVNCADLERLSTIYFSSAKQLVS